VMALAALASMSRVRAEGERPVKIPMTVFVSSENISQTNHALQARLEAAALRS
jgi:hypothetical protein